jgi:hypothetical protein
MEASRAPSHHAQRCLGHGGGRRGVLACHQAAIRLDVHPPCRAPCEVRPRLRQPRIKEVGHLGPRRARTCT